MLRVTSLSSRTGIVAVFKLSAQRNETETKQFWNCLVSVSFRRVTCVYSLMRANVLFARAYGE